MKHRAIEGVNLGGWLLLERWMTPSVFKGSDAQDEYTLSGQPGMKKRIDAHRKSFITEEDWQWLSKNNVTHVRLPVGYWVLDDDGPFYNAKKYLDWAFVMAEKYSIHILLDLHGLKGSQNAEMHSGRVGKVDWRRYKQQHMNVLEGLAKRYKDSPSFWGLEIINEPRVFGNYFALVRYYREAYSALRQIVRPGTYIVFQDGFLPPLFSGTLWKRNTYPVAMDTHFYLIFPKVLRWMSAVRYDTLRTVLYASLVWTTRVNQPIIIGEWSSVLPQSFFDRVPQSEHMKLLGETIVRQREMYTYAIATFYWSYKTEGRGMYHYRSLVEDGVITR